MMSEKIGINLYGSDDILVYPDGSYEITVLEKILSDATYSKLPKNELIIITHDQRVSNFDSNNPEWEKVKYSVSLQSLFDLYKKIEGFEYRELSLDELKQNHRLGF
jgi:hypothetical protein